MAKIISGKEVSASVRAQVKKECDELKAKGIAPGLAVIIVGDDPASRVYVNNKKKACADVGFVSEEYALPASTTLTELLKLIDELNVKKEINGILCQLPLPEHLDEKAVINAISKTELSQFVTAEQRISKRSVLRQIYLLPQSADRNLLQQIWSKRVQLSLM